MSEEAPLAHRAAQPADSSRAVLTLLRLWSPATVATLILAFWALLYVSPDASRAAVVASVMVLALAAVVSSYVRSSLSELAERAEHDMVAPRRPGREWRGLHADELVTRPVADPEIAREIDAAVKGMMTNLTLMAEQVEHAATGDCRDDLVAVEHAVSKALAECNQITLGFAAELPAEHRHRFNNAVMPLAYSLAKATKRLTRLVHAAPHPHIAVDPRSRALLKAARASAERLGVLVRTVEAATPLPRR